MRKENNIKDIIVEEVIKQMKNFCNENIRLITEKWSISDEVQDAKEQLLNYLKEIVHSGECTTVIKGQLYFYKGTIKNYKILNKVINLNYYLYDCINEEICNYVYNEGYHVDGLDEKTNELNITLYMIQGKWKELYCEKNTVHELEHILQIRFGEQNNDKYERLTNYCYDLANKILMETNRHSIYEVMLAKLFYYSNSHEQDAFIQEYAIELKYNLNRLYTKNTELHLILKMMKDYYNRFLNEKSAFSIAVKDYQIYGYTYNSMSKMFSRQINRLEKKMKRVENNFRRSEVRENVFKIEK